MISKKLKDFSTIEFAKFIEKRPGMFLGDQITLTNLWNMLLGFDVNSTESIPPFHYFNYWTKKKLNKLGGGYSWRNAILEANNSNERQAFDNFFELLDEFLTLKPKSINSVLLTEENFTFYYNKENNNKSRRIIGDTMDSAILCPAPYQIKLVEFDYCTHAYHYNFYYVVGEYDKGKYSQEFDDLNSSKETYSKKFGKLEWTETDYMDIENEFQLIVENANNYS
ncbi:hypothetical protein U6A24_06855 [Aquimarina gracilis]|uniref:Uncharacterized protein n=1 Tax=Aquimarina gracilis TaxID=874422 RepID=A0ABU5ZSV6_9FLAO|nr:hypothetical protein [Aquimarina gracilis]MEB3345170.1 hypothetical protein [Aquimarina gracilis]